MHCNGLAQCALCDVIMGTMASQITSLTIVYPIVHSGADQRKHQSSASLAFVRGIHRWPVNSPHKRPVTRKMFPFDDVIIMCGNWQMPLLGYMSPRKSKCTQLKHNGITAWLFRQNYVWISFQSCRMDTVTDKWYIHLDHYNHDVTEYTWLYINVYECRYFLSVVTAWYMDTWHDGQVICETT